MILFFTKQKALFQKKMLTNIKTTRKQKKGHQCPVYLYPMKNILETSFFNLLIQ